MAAPFIARARRKPCLSLNCELTPIAPAAAHYTIYLGNGEPPKSIGDLRRQFRQSNWMDWKGNGTPD